MGIQNKKSSIDWFIIDRVKQLRIENNLSQHDVAVHLDLSTGFIGHIENPNHRAKYNTLHLNKLAKLFKCSPKDFWPEQPL
ncbi:XRE family transcriptional regulator [Segetibacter sp. 3557_3]|uniref:helix-turn-helix domain-containing protein n=1 Tax=Segetibacter sp. 3557_3 TaxID=2547429 RepID=UPI001058ADC2|nr:helix-turn-helix transcriptional regulator [Segetibacter sp. 3557_3]TDH18146.1 XRE family transcriptional regulator [Segetibacter sp. 3557_3]